MGMDVYGKNPTSPTGEYFRNNVWWWHPLADYILQSCPWTDRPEIFWHSNDCTGLNAIQSLQLAEELQAQLESGAVVQYATERAARLATLPEHPCFICGGTGRRAAAPQTGPGPYGCNGCGGDYREANPSEGLSGTGFQPDDETGYSFSEQNVAEFVAFLRDCGGFEIC